MTDQPEPVRKSLLPCIPPPEWEFHTWYPRPDGGGDLSPGQHDRGAHVRRQVTYGDWEPVRPDHWADDPADLTGYLAPEPAIRCLTVTAEHPSEPEPVGTIGGDWPSRRAGLRDQLAAALYERERPPRDPAWADAYAMDREVFGPMADTVLTVLYREWPWLQAEAEDAARTTPKNPAEQRAPEVRDPCPRCESSPARIPRRLMAEHMRDIHPEEQQP